MRLRKLRQRLFSTIPYTKLKEDWDQALSNFMHFLHTRLRNAGMKIFFNWNIHDKDYFDLVKRNCFYQRWAQSIRIFIKKVPPPHDIIFYYPERKPDKTLRQACLLSDLFDWLTVDEELYCKELNFYGIVRLKDPDNLQFYPLAPPKGNDFCSSDKQHYRKRILEPMMKTASFKRTFRAVNWSHY